MKKTIFFLIFTAMIGCDARVTHMGEKKETFGRVLIAGKPLADAKVVLQPLDDGADAHGITDKTGHFKTNATPGRYTWYLIPKDARKSSETAIKSVPYSFKSGSMERIVFLDSGELHLEIK